MRVAVVGATGLIGRRLCAALLARGDRVTAVSRGGRAGIPGAEDRRWDPADGPPAPPVLEGADAVVNLAGSPMHRWPWTAARKREIHDSRVSTTRLLVDALGAEGGPRALVSAAGVNYYAPRGDEEVDEAAPAGDDFLARVVIAWEREAVRAAERGVRTVSLRAGIVLAREGGALPQLALPVRLFAGGPLGGGRQWVPWIHIDDQIGLILLALDRDDLSGPLNCVAPQAVRQREFVAALGRVLRRPAVLPAPGILVRLALGEMSTLALEGQRVVPAAARRAGYRFLHPELEEALRSLLG